MTKSGRRVNLELMIKKALVFFSQKETIFFLPFIFLLLNVLALLPLAFYLSNQQKSLDFRSRGATAEAELSLPLIASFDDAFEDADINGKVTVENTNQQIRLGWYQRAAGLRFNSIALAQIKSAKIIQANLKVKASTNSDAKVKYGLFLEKSDDCQKFEPSQRNLSQRSLTEKSVLWDLSQEPWINTKTYQSPDIKEAVVEVTGRQNWQGKSLCLILVNNFSESYRERTFWAQEKGDDLPVLVIKYEKEETPAPTPDGASPVPSVLPTVLPTALPSLAPSPTPQFSPLATFRPSPTGNLSSPSPAANLGVRTMKKGAAGIVYPGAATKSPPLYEKLGTSWFYGWHADPNGLSVAEKSCREFVPMLNWKGTEEMARRLIVDYNKKGLYWLIGNEPDLAGSEDSDGYHAIQENLLSLYIRLAKKVKTLDPTAKLILGGFASVANYTSTNQPQPPGYNFARLLKDRLRGEGITPSGWHIHLYNCCSFDDFKNSLRNWKSWQNTVLGGGETWITEFGALQTRTGTSEFMTDTINFMENTTDPNYRVNRYAWFYLLPWNDISHYLANPDGTLTQFGRLYARLPDGRERPKTPLCQQ